MHKQRGAAFITWVAGLGLVILLFLTLVKLIPIYLEFYAVRSMVNDIATESGMSVVNNQQLRRKVSDYLNVNSLNIALENFMVVPVEGKANTYALAVNYEVRKHWIANIDFLTAFSYSVELNRPGVGSS